MAQFGNTILFVAMILTALSSLLCLLPGRRERRLATVRHLLYGAAVATAIGVVVLAFLLVSHDYRVEYVRTGADRTMRTGFLLTAVWGGQQGSLLFWALLQTIASAAVAAFTARRSAGLAPHVMAVMGIFSLFFLALVLFLSNPFAPSAVVSPDGIGMNPLLRNAWMAIHPPALFAGFAGFSIPAAFAIAALAADRVDDGWVGDIRPFVLVAFGCLSAGNLLGMVWAYEELGWGGYWGWDPVENASLMPWLTGTALVHSMLAQQGRGILKGWTILLAAVTWLFVIFGTFLTRSGVIQSVHAFSGARTGPYFLAAMAACAVAFGVLSFRRRASLASSAAADLRSKEWMFEFTNLLFLLAALFVGIATLWPLITQLWKGEQASVTPSFFNRWMVPVGLLIAAVMGLCSLFPWQGAQKQVTLRAWLVPAIIGLSAGVLTGLLGGFKGASGSSGTFAPAVSAGLLAFTASILAVAFRRSLLAGNRRRMGGQIVHLAVVLLFVGFTGAGWTQEVQGTLSPGEFLSVGGTRVTFMGLRTDVNFRREAVHADLEVADEEGHSRVLSPARLYYHSHPGQPTSEVAIDSSVGRDLFFALGEIDFENGRAFIKVIRNPLVLFVWLGGALMVMGIVVALIPAGSLLRLLDPDATRQRTRRMVLVRMLVPIGVCGFAAFAGGAALALVAAGALLLVGLSYLLLRALNAAMEK